MDINELSQNNLIGDDARDTNNPPILPNPIDIIQTIKNRKEPKKTKEKIKVVKAVNKKNLILED